MLRWACTDRSSSGNGVHGRARAATAVSKISGLAIQVPQRVPATAARAGGMRVSNRSENTRPRTSNMMSADSKSSQRPASGYHALYTDSFALKSIWSQHTPGTAARRPAIRARSESRAMLVSMSGLRNRRFGAASSPRDTTSEVCATAAARYPAQCVMLPVTPPGHRGAPSSSARTGTGGWPSRASAARAHFRAVANSLRRRGDPRAMSASSPGNSTAPGSSPNASAAWTGGGSNSSIMGSPGAGRMVCGPPIPVPRRGRGRGRIARCGGRRQAGAVQRDYHRGALFVTGLAANDLDHFVIHEAPLSRTAITLAGCRAYGTAGRRACSAASPMPRRGRPGCSADR